MDHKEYLLQKSNTCKELGHILLSDLLFNFSKLDSKSDVVKYAELNRVNLVHYPYANLTLHSVISDLS